MEMNCCSYCYGGGYLNVKLNGERLTNNDLRLYLDGKYKAIQCPKCRGQKTLDWIEQIVGFKPGRSKNENT